MISPTATMTYPSRAARHGRPRRQRSTTPSVITHITTTDLGPQTRPMDSRDRTGQGEGSRGGTRSTRGVRPDHPAPAITRNRSAAQAYSRRRARDLVESGNDRIGESSAGRCPEFWLHRGEAMTATKYRSVDVDGLNVFYR